MSSKIYTATFILLAAWLVSRLMVMMSGSDRQPPDMDLDRWWGPGERVEFAQEDVSSIRPYTITWDKAMIIDLKDRLKNRRKSMKPLEGVAFEYGTNADALEPILEYWRHQYNFTERQEYFNQYPQFKTKVQGLDIHFLWVKPKNLGPKTKVLPLLIMHGWPGSVREFYELIPHLTKPRTGFDFVFEVIAPSLPGFGYSDAPARPGLGSSEMGVVMRNLMHRLGHQQFYVQGGDWGGIIGSAMATIFPEEILGYHTNMPSASNVGYHLRLVLGAYLPFILEPALASRVYPLTSYFTEMLAESGYFHLQATKPDTLGIGLSDSPAGLAGYILEKFSSGTNLNNRFKPDGGLTDFHPDELLDNLMVYWSSNSITSSIRLYKESCREGSYMKMMEVPTAVPTWAAHAINEPLFLPATLMRTKYLNLLDVSLLEDGGHFLALECPKLLAEDLFRAAREFLMFHKRKKLMK